MRGVKQLGRRLGNWLTPKEGQRLLSAVTTDTLRGKRDLAMLGLLLGCGLRRSELVELDVDQIQQREQHLQWLARFGVPIFLPEATAFGVIGGLLGGLAVVVWWAFLSRAPRSERWGAVVLMIVALVATSRIIHESIATGMMGLMFVIYAIPVLSLAFVAWAVASRRLSDGPRRAAMVATILLG